jgi:hypothetical protein
MKPPAEYFSVHPKELSPLHKTPKQVNKKEPKEVQLTLSLVRCEGTKETKKTKGITSTHTEISNYLVSGKATKTQTTSTKNEDHTNKSKNHSD